MLFYFLFYLGVNRAYGFLFLVVGFEEGQYINFMILWISSNRSTEIWAYILKLHSFYWALTIIQFMGQKNKLEPNLA